MGERAEEYQVAVTGGGRITRVFHQLPEATSAPSLAEKDARALAHQTLRDRFGFDPGTLREVEASPSRQKNRTDWLFTFAVPVQPPLKQGETRAGVSIAGDQVNDADRFVYVPEEWTRAERDRQTIPSLISIACLAFIGLAASGGIITGIVSWIRRRFSLRSFLVLAPLLFVVNIAGRFNQLPALMAAFSSAQPYQLQLGVIVVSLLIAFTALALGVAVLGGYVTRAPREPRTGPAGRWVAGMSVAFLAAGLGAAMSRLAPSFSPAWPSYAPLATYAPWIAPPLDGVSALVTEAVIGWFFVGLVDALTDGWTRRRAAGAAFVLVLGLAVAGFSDVNSLPWWAASGALAGAFGLAAYVFVFRPAPEVLPIAVATALTLNAIKAAMVGRLPGRRVIIEPARGGRVRLRVAAAAPGEATPGKGDRLTDSHLSRGSCRLRLGECQP